MTTPTRVASRHTLSTTSANPNRQKAADSGITWRFRAEFIENVVGNDYHTPSVFAVLCSESPSFLNTHIRTKCRATIRDIRDMVKTRVNQGENGQYKVTVPKGIADALELDGKRLEWTIRSGSKLEAKIVDD